MARLRPEEKKFALEFIKNGGNATQAVLDAGIESKTRNAAGVKGNKLLNRPRVQQEIQSIADSIPDKLLIERHLQLLNVPKIKRTYRKGELEHETEELDSNAISRGLDMAYKIKGTYAPEKNVNLNVDIDTKDPKAIALAKEYEERLKQGL